MFSNSCCQCVGGDLWGVGSLKTKCFVWSVQCNVLPLHMGVGVGWGRWFPTPAQKPHLAFAFVTAGFKLLQEPCRGVSISSL